MTFKTTHLLAALTLSLGAGVFTPRAVLADGLTDQAVLDKEKAPKTSTVVGTITSLDLDNNTFTVKTNGEGEADKVIEVTVTDETKYMLGMKVSTQGEVLVQDAKVRIKHKDGVADSVTRMVKGDKPPKPDKPKKPKEPKSPDKPE